MKRKFFFWLEKLKITPAERQAVSIVMGILLVFGTVNMALSPVEPFADDQYLELQKQFEQRTAMLELEEQKLMQRYHPPVVQRKAIAAAVDTIPEKKESKRSSKQKPDKSKPEQKSRINVNTADQETLQLLPGIGPAYSKRIILYREENNSFKTIEELKEIKGIGEKRLEKLKPFVKLKDPE